ncbi:MAG TPA: SDR family oxidoreductase [Polyangiaceae bacterium LLY-WYZ-15_(1-7)]|nr:oxidoreductase [Sandaracinus sp.]HJL04534.1 SDR family oxidoreductase [Polyangiaceae bacterium LLY-WYZ-15_(1-7)]HJL08504.1 SDR family oxidoreductase [Polyangiaceae bacterium LLY-WYZ-15_(1-7)]HJL23215.1 SDR family oxidoreductase [Polyangiaceae bacterium LLY-WYZ-15_(1-7)]HJL39035.1 SDR family oxidoreductase [Polyangiaceae bacterium LLY-WYZ-15_(1-7)]
MTTLVTGFPTSFLASRVVRRLLDDPEEVVWCVVQKKGWEEAEAIRADLAPARRKRLRFLEGDCASLDLGLSGAELNMLAREIDRIHHCAAVTYLGAERALAERTNLGGAREILEIAEAAPRLERLVHWSTALVSGDRRGYVLEEELGGGECRNVVEETRRRAERIVREAMDHLPITVMRPSIVVGDSVTGEVDRLEGPYLLVLLMLGAPPDLRMPMPGRGDIPLNLVPIDFVVEAGLHIAADARSLGRTFHVVDPDPLTARRVFELIAEATGRPIPRGYVPTSLATVLMRTPGLERFAHVPRTFLEQLATEVVWDDRNTRELLEGTGISCPAFEDYVERLVEYVRQRQAERRTGEIDLGLEAHDVPQ